MKTTTDNLRDVDIGKTLRTKREQLGLTPKAMAARIGCNRTTVERFERGESTVRASTISGLVSAYELNNVEVASLFGERAKIRQGWKSDWDIPVSTEDLEYLITVSKGLQSPMCLVQVKDLIKLRQPKTS